MPSLIDQRRLADGKVAIEAKPPPFGDRDAWIGYVAMLASAIAALQSTDDLGSEEANEKAWKDMLAIEAKWKDAKKTLADMQPARKR